jgi:hypothetical protein
MNPNHASSILNKEISKLQKQMKAEIDKVVKEHQEQSMPNARVLITLVEFADQLAERLDAIVDYNGSNSEDKEDKGLIEQYKMFRQTLNLPEA